MQDLENVLNKGYIDEFVGIAGTEPFLSAIELFHSGMKDYLNACQELFYKGEYEDAAKELHKLKGAGSSIGLARMMVEAKSAELKLLAEREDYSLAQEIEKLQKMAAEDVKVLEGYIAIFNK